MEVKDPYWLFILTLPTLSVPPSSHHLGLKSAETLVILHKINIGSEYPLSLYTFSTSNQFTCFAPNICADVFVLLIAATLAVFSNNLIDMRKAYFYVCYFVRSNESSGLAGLSFLYHEPGRSEKARGRDACSDRQGIL